MCISCLVLSLGNKKYQLLIWVQFYSHVYLHNNTGTLLCMPEHAGQVANNN